MSYGLIVKSFDAGGNEIIQMDTTQGLTNYVIVKMGRGHSVAAGTPYGKNRRIFVKPISDENGLYVGAATYTGGINSRYGISILSGSHGATVLKFVTSDYAAWSGDGFAWNEAYNPVTVDYIIMEDVTGVEPEGQYGLQALSASGESSFDSRKIKYNAGLRITSIVPPRSLGGGASSSDLINNDSSKYIGAEWTNWDSLGSLAAINVEGGTQNTYHLDMDRDEPDPDQNFYPTYYYDNYTGIWIAEQI